MVHLMPVILYIFFVEFLFRKQEIYIENKVLLVNNAYISQCKIVFIKAQSKQILNI